MAEKAKDSFVSIVLRLAIDSEAMNMVEAIGAFTPHRSAPIVVRIGDGLRVVRAPAASGQMMAYAYQKALVELASKANTNMPLCDDCRNYKTLGGFVKRATADPDSFKDGEFSVIETCVVEDLSGFMIVGKGRRGSRRERRKGGEEEEGEEAAGLRRTSPVWFSYLLPEPHLTSFKFEPQFHVRFNVKEGNNPFTVENAAAIYTLAIAIDVKAIGRAADRNGVIREVGDRDRRVALALEALRAVFHGQLFGAKKSRNLFRFEIVGGAASISNPLPFTLSPPIRGDESYVAKSYRRARSMGAGLSRTSIAQEINMAYFDGDGIAGDLKSIVESVVGQGAKAEGDRYCEKVEAGSICLERVRDFDQMIDWIRNKIFGKA